MKQQQSLIVLILLGLLILTAGSGCTETASQAAARVEATARPSATATSLAVAGRPISQQAGSAPRKGDAPREEALPEAATALTPQPTGTALPTPVATSAAALEVPMAEVIVDAGNLRSRPGLAYPVVGVVRRGDVLNVLNRNRAGDWLQIGWEEEPAWLSASLVTLTLSVSELEVAEAIDPPPAAAPVAPAALEVPKCDTVPIRGFGTVWGGHLQVAATLGCPSWPYREEGTEAAVQSFEHGLMLWLAADSSYGGDPVYALFENGEYQRFPDMGPADPAVVEAVSEGYYAPGDLFSKVYWEGTGARVRERLGRATGPQLASSGAYQQFDRGRMFWMEAADSIFVLYDYWEWDESGQNGTHIRSWTAFEDRFGG
jgi:hypothetical protein